MMQRVSLPGSEYYLRFDYSGNKTDKRSSNSSGVLSRKLDRPDMLLVSGGATVLVGEDKVSMNVWQLCSICALVTMLMPHSGLSDVDMEVYECRQRATCTKLSKILKATSREAFEALQYGSINYLPCYVAAGLLVKLGLFNTLGEVWSISWFHAIALLQQHSSKYCFSIEMCTRMVLILVCAVAVGVRPVLVCYIVFCIAVTKT